MKGFRRRLTLAGGLIGAGIVGQTLTLYWDHPLAFLVFLFLASPLVLAGILVYLWSLPGVE